MSWKAMEVWSQISQLERYSLKYNTHLDFFVWMCLCFYCFLVRSWFTTSKENEWRDYGGGMECWHCWKSKLMIQIEKAVQKTSAGWQELGREKSQRLLFLRKQNKQLTFKCTWKSFLIIVHGRQFPGKKIVGVLRKWEWECTVSRCVT